MAYHVPKYLLPKWEKYPADEITADKVNKWIGEPELQHLSPTSLKHIVTTLCLILGRWFERAKNQLPVCHRGRDGACLLHARPGAANNCESRWHQESALFNGRRDWFCEQANFML